MASSSRLRRWADQLAPTFVFALLFGGGILVGHYFESLSTRRAIDGFLDRTTLGDHVDSSRRRAYASAYHDPSEAEANMDGYAWVVPVVPVPFVGTAPAPGRHANATINGQHLRHPSELVVPRPEGKVRIFVTGGSTSFGSGAPDQERTISGYLQALLEAELSPLTGLRYEVVNAANPAWTTTHERLWIIQWLAQHDPDLIVSLSGNNDVHWGLEGESARWLRVHGDEHFRQLLALAYGGAGRSLPDAVAAPAGRVPPDRVARDLAANVDLVTHFLTARRVPYVFALQPTLAVTGKALSEREAARRERLERRRGAGAVGYFLESYRAIAEALRAHEAAGEGFAFVDLTGVFDREAAETEIFLDAYHFGDRGNERIARALYASLRPQLAQLGTPR